MSSSKADFYVATNGNDAWSGTLPEPNAEGTDGPFATLQQAQAAVRIVKAEKKAPITVMIREGTHFIGESLVFEAQDSGAEGQPITYTAYPGETPVLSGGGRHNLQEWREHGFGENSIHADPMFVDPENGDYRVKPESPALKLGFKNFDMDKFGLLPDFPEKWRD